MKVTTFRELMREQANAALHVSGAHHSSWNGRFGAPLDRQSDLGGTANWDNSISYNPRHVDERLQEMFRNARVHLQDKADLRGYRDALRVVRTRMCISCRRKAGNSRSRTPPWRTVLVFVRSRRG